jgi:hypothetical protein
LRLELTSIARTFHIQPTFLEAAPGIRFGSANGNDRKHLALSSCRPTCRDARFSPTTPRFAIGANRHRLRERLRFSLRLSFLLNPSVVRLEQRHGRRRLRGSG